MPPSQQSELHMGAAPTDAVILSRVFGYSCEASRNNAKYTACGAVVYPAGATVVRVDVGSGGQSFGTFHAGSEICALAISKDINVGNVRYFRGAENCSMGGVKCCRGAKQSNTRSAFECHYTPCIR